MVGDVTTVSFVIEDGGRLNGRTTMVKMQKPASQAGQALQIGIGEREAD